MVEMLCDLKHYLGLNNIFKPEAKQFAFPCNQLRTHYGNNSLTRNTNSIIYPTVMLKIKIF